MNTPTLAEQMTTLLGIVDSVMTQLVDWVGDLITLVTSQPYLMVGFSIILISFAIGVLVRIVGRLGHSAR